jgi:hypothetical protein
MEAVRPIAAIGPSGRPPRERSGFGSRRRVSARVFEFCSGLVDAGVPSLIPGIVVANHSWPSERSFVVVAGQVAGADG